MLQCDLTETTLLSVKKMFSYLFLLHFYALCHALQGLCRWGLLAEKGEKTKEKKN